MTTTQATESRRWAPLLAAVAAFVLLDGLALATTWTVRVGRGGLKFVDDSSGTNVSTIHAGDTVTWVWEGEMEHSVTSGTCPDDNGGGGGGYGYVYAGGYGGGSCTESTEWEESTLHGSGFSFSHTFLTSGTINYFCEMHQSAMTGKIIVQPAAVGGPCDPSSPERLCLNGGRFEVTAEWTKPDSSSGHGTGVKLTDDSGYFWFFTDTNIELVTKVLNACSFATPAYWVFSAGLTNVGVSLTVRDTQTDAVYSYVNPTGTVFPTQTATSAFPSSCP